jgi:hypothetical protein
MEIMLEQTQSAAPEAATGFDGNDGYSLEGILRLSRNWLERLPAADPQRANLLRIQNLARILGGGGENSYLAVSYVRAMLCVTCRRLDAAHGKCFGQTLDRCLLLNRTVP